jgi:ATP-dependent Clp protease, protease subunit
MYLSGSQTTLMAKHMNKEKEVIERDIERPRYFNPYEAVDYGIIDRVS